MQLGALVLGEVFLQGRDGLGGNTAPALLEAADGRH